MESQPSRARRRLSLSAAILLAGLAAVGAAWLVGSRVPGPVGGWLRSRLTLYAGGVLLAAVVGLYLLGGAMWRLGRSQRPARVRREQAGTAAIEFALVFPIALMIVLVMIQSMLVVTANLAVHRAAYDAVRAAITWVPEKVSYEEPRNVVGDPDSSAKFHRVRSAAVYAVMAISAGKPGAGGAGSAGSAGTIADGIRTFFERSGKIPPRWVETMLEPKFQYAWDFTEVTLFPPANGAIYGDHEDLSVRVRHVIYLAVPYANRIFGQELAGGSGDYGTEAEATYALTNQGIEDDIDVEQFPRTVGRDEW
jgi:hypothetical protein